MLRFPLRPSADFLVWVKLWVSGSSGKNEWVKSGLHEMCQPYLTKWWGNVSTRRRITNKTHSETEGGTRVFSCAAFEIDLLSSSAFIMCEQIGKHLMHGSCCIFTLVVKNHDFTV